MADNTEDFPEFFGSEDTINFQQLTGKTRIYLENTGQYIDRYTEEVGEEVYLIDRKFLMYLLPDYESAIRDARYQLTKESLPGSKQMIDMFERIIELLESLRQGFTSEEEVCDLINQLIFEITVLESFDLSVVKVKFPDPEYLE